MDESNSGRIGQTDYWIFFGVYFVLCIFLIVGSISALVNGSLGLALIAMLLIPVLNIWFRVIMMRRCRDIGWPTFLPWITFALSFLSGFVGGASGGGAAAMLSGALIIPMILGLIDFAFMIAIGCISSQSFSMPDARDYERLYRDLPQAPIGYAEGKAELKDVRFADDARAMPRPAGGFGRRAV